MSRTIPVDETTYNLLVEAAKLLRRVYEEGLEEEETTDGGVQLIEDILIPDDLYETICTFFENHGG